LMSGTRIYISISLFLAGLFIALDAFSCSTAAWIPGGTGSVEANNPANGVPRINGSCGVKVTGTGHVQDNSADAEAKLIVRFYFLPQLDGTGSTDIFVAYSDESPIPDANLTKLFSVKYDNDNSNIVVDATAANGGTTSVAVIGNHWHLIEFSWESGQTGSLWVDADATSDPASSTFASGTGTVESVRLGAPNGFGALNGMAFFDDYVSHRSLPVGGVLTGDGNLDGIFDQNDIDAIKAEFLFGTYPSGSTDCNLDSNINSGDVNCVVEKL
jgi:hypothetical protein